MSSSDTAKALTKNYSGLLSMARPQNAITMLLSFLIGYMFYGNVNNWIHLAIGIIIMLLLHTAWVIQHDTYSIAIDRANGETSPLIRKEVDLQTADQLAINLIFGAMFVSLLGHRILLCAYFVAAFVAVAWLYNCPPFTRSKKPIISLVLLGLLYSGLPLAFGINFSRGDITTQFIWLVILLSLIRISIAALKDFTRVRGDKQFGRRTFYLVYGKLPTALLSTVLATIAYTAAIVLIHSDVIPITVSPFMASLLIGVAILNIGVRISLFYKDTERDLDRVFKINVIGENLFEILVLVCIIFG